MNRRGVHAIRDKSQSTVLKSTAQLGSPSSLSGPLGQKVFGCYENDFFTECSWFTNNPDVGSYRRLKRRVEPQLPPTPLGRVSVVYPKSTHDKNPSRIWPVSIFLLLLVYSVSWVQFNKAIGLPGSWILAMEWARTCKENVENSWQQKVNYWSMLFPSFSSLRFQMKFGATLVISLEYGTRPLGLLLNNFKQHIIFDNHLNVCTYHNFQSHFNMVFSLFYDRSIPQ